MSREIVEIGHTLNDAVRRGDWDTVAAYLDPDILLRTDPRWPEQRVYGREVVVVWHRVTQESVGPDVSIEEIIELRDMALIRVCWFVRGQHSDAQGEMLYSELNTYREGRVVLSEFFLEHGQALKAVGLEE